MNINRDKIATDQIESQQVSTTTNIDPSLNIVTDNIVEDDSTLSIGQGTLKTTRLNERNETNGDDDDGSNNEGFERLPDQSNRVGSCIANARAYLFQCLQQQKVRSMTSPLIIQHSSRLTRNE
jgi:hypothetical protein